MGLESDRSDLVRVFVSETSDGLTTLAEALRIATDFSSATHTLQEQYIIAHRIRGAAALYGYEGISRVAEQLEGIFERAVEQLPPDWPRVVAVMRETIQDLSTLVALVGQGNGEDHRPGSAVSDISGPFKRIVDHAVVRRCGLCEALT